MVEKVVGLAVIGGLAAALASIGAGYAVGSGGHASAAKVSIVTVTAGKPSELSFLLSRSSDIPAGLVEFKVIDRGVAFHNFKICTTVAGTALIDSCVGKATKNLRPGQSTTLTVTLKRGMHEFLCTLTGHAAAGMKGLVGIGVALTPAEVPLATAALSGSTTLGSTSTGSTTSGVATTGTTTAGTTTAGTTTAGITTPGTTTPATTTTALTTPATTTTATTTPATTTTSGSGTDASADPACPAGETIKTGGNSDDDGDELGSPSDGDGCI